MRITSTVISYLPRFALAVLAVPAAFVLVAFAAIAFGAEAARPAAGAGAVTFALVVLAPSTAKAVLRAGLACATAGIFWTVALLAR